MLRLSEILRLTQDDKYRKFILIAIMSDMYYREPICTTVIPDMCDRESIGEGFWIESILVPLKVKRYLIRPLPILNFRHIVTVLRNVRFMIDLFIADRLLGIGRKISQLRHTINHIRHKMKPVQIV